MTTYQIKSTAILNRDAVPKVTEDAWLNGGRIRESWGYVQSNGGADGIGSTYLLATVPSHARVSSLFFQTSGLGTSCTLDIGVWYPTYIPQGSNSALTSSLANTAINTTVFASAYACSSAVAATELISTAQIAINKQEAPLWSMAGLTSDPGIDLDIVAYVHAAVALQGYVGLRARYCV